MYRLHLCSIAIVMIACAGGVGCAASGASHDFSRDGSVASSTAASSSSGEGGEGGFALGTGGDEGSGGGSEFVKTPVRTLPGLSSITFYETTNVTVAYEFAVAGVELTAKLPDPLGEKANFDISGALSEFYDVYYSDADGASALDGSYLTISGVFSTGSPYGGGLNLAEIGLGYDDETTEYGNYVASAVALGDNADPTSADRCIDGDLSTYTTMGNTIGSAERLRLTLGFLSTSCLGGVPEMFKRGVGVALRWAGCHACSSGEFASLYSAAVSKSMRADDGTNCGEILLPTRLRPRMRVLWRADHAQFGWRQGGER